MPHTFSRDGTRIGYTRTGAGRPVILVDGALCSRAMGPMPALAEALAPHFTVFTYDRRGRGESGDAKAWAVDREVEDLDAMIAEAGGSASVVGLSSGAALALEAAHRGSRIDRLAVYEPPLIVDDTRTPTPHDFLAELKRLRAEDRRGEIVKRFMKLVGTPGFAVVMMRLMPVWKQLSAVAHTVPYDIEILDGLQFGHPIPPGRWSGATMPTLVLDGGKSPVWMRNGVRAAADALPNAQYRTLPGQTHMVKTPVLAAALVDFLGAGVPAGAAA